MKRNVFMTVCMLGLFLSSSLLFAADLQVIAIHFGNPEYSSVLSPEKYEGFDFYTSDGSTYLYHEEQKLAGASRYLKGYYGDIPERFGFSANYTTEKNKPYPYKQGLVLLVGPNGVISAKTPSERVSPNSIDSYDQVFYSFKKELKRLSKGKMMEPLKENKRNYFKTAPIGEREFYKKSKIDSKGNGLLGWPLPDLTITDSSGAQHQLKDLTDNKLSMIVFYTMNAVHCKKGDKSGYIIKEYDPEMPLNAEKEITKSINESPTPGQAFLKSMKAASSQESQEYKKSVVLLELVKQVAGTLK